MNLDQDAVSSFNWVGLSTVVNAFVQLAQVALLARFLTSTEFGMMALIQIVVTFSTFFLDMGFSNAVIQKQDVTHRQLTGLYWLNIAVGIITFLAIYSLSPFIAIVFDSQSISSLIKVAAASFLIVPFGQLYRVILQKELKFRMLAVTDMIATGAALLCSLALALQGYGVYSLVLAMLLNNAVITIGCMLVGVRHFVPSGPFSLDDLRSFYGFGLFQTGEKVINYFGAQVDKLIIGRYLGMDALGLYNMAWNIIIFPILRINPVFTQVAFPIFSKIQNMPEQLNRYYGKMLSMIMLINFPLMAGLFLSADEIVRLFYGPGWERTAPIIRILAAAGLLKSFANPGWTVILAKGRADVGFYLNIVWVFLIGAISYPAARSGSLNAVAYGQTAATLLIGLAWHSLVIKYGEISYRSFLPSILKTALMTAGMSFVVYLLGHLVELSTIQSLVTKIMIGLLTYGSLLFYFDRESFDLIRRRGY